MKKMKQFSFRVIATAIAVAIFAAFVFCSCESTTDVSNPTEKVKIFMSGVSASDGPMRAPSATDENQSERKAIANGDTVDVYNIKNVNVLLIAEKENGLLVDGRWGIYNIDNDLDVSKHDTIAMDMPGGGFIGSTANLKMSYLGLYMVNFYPKNGASISFYIRHTGTPGITGDDWTGNYIFRLDKNSYTAGGTNLNKGYTLYLKSYNYFPNLPELGENNPILERNWRALLDCDNNYFTQPGGFIRSAKIFQLRRCKYSPEYVRFSFLEKDCPPIDGSYQTYFYSGDFGWIWSIFSSVQDSYWENNDQIVFKVI